MRMMHHSHHRAIHGASGTSLWPRSGSAAMMPCICARSPKAGCPLGLCLNYTQRTLDRFLRPDTVFEKQERQQRRKRARIFTASLFLAQAALNSTKKKAAPRRSGRRRCHLARKAWHTLACSVRPVCACARTPCVLCSRIASLMAPVRLLSYFPSIAIAPLVLHRRRRTLCGQQPDGSRALL